MDNKDNKNTPSEDPTEEGANGGLDDSLNDDIMNESTLASSGDSDSHKRQQMRTPSPGRPHSPENSDYMVAASPPKYVSLDHIMQTAQGVGNMTLAHEIAVDEQFELKKFTPENSLERRVRDIMHQAFWDGLKEKLYADPPDFTPAMNLIEEVKESLLDVLLPHHQKLRVHIDSVLDTELIKQQAEHGTLDINHYAAFVIDIMSKLCAPVRDERVATLHEIKDIVELFREIFTVLDLMKMDMANFTIQQIRPFIKQQSVQYERKKFADFLKVQEENNMDGLQHVKEWILRHANKLQYTEGHEGSEPIAPPPTPAAVLNTAFLELLDWDTKYPYPETLLMDQGRFLILHERTQQLTLISAILLVTYSTVGASITGITSLKDKLKDEMLIIMADKLPSELGELVHSISDYVVKEVGACLKGHGFAEMDDAKKTLLKGQVEAVVSADHPVHKLIKSRILTFILQIMTTTNPTQIKFPPGTSTISEELNVICGQYFRIVAHNRNVFGNYYGEIIQGLLKRTQGARSPRLS